MAFPTDPLGAAVELYLGGAWVDISSYVLVRDGISISRGRPDESSSTPPSRATLTVRNDDGRFSPRNPTSPYYGLIGRNTPLRIRVEDVMPTPSLRSAVTTAATDQDIGYTVTVPTGVLAGDVLLAFQSADSAVLDDLAEPAVASGTVPGGWTEIAAEDDTSINSLVTKVWWKISTGAEPTSYIFFHNDASDGVCTMAAIKDASHARPIVAFSSAISGSPLGTAHSTPSSTPAGNNDFELRWVAMAKDSTPAANTWTPPVGFTERSDLQSTTWTTGSLATRPLTSNAATGTHNFTSSSSEFNVRHSFTVNVMAASVRFTGEVSSWPPRWNLAGTDVYTPIEASGIMRRLGQGAKPLKSAIARGILDELGSSLKAYWRLEDGDDATQFANELAGGAPMRPVGTVSPAGSIPIGAATLPVVSFGSAGQLAGGVTASWPSPTAWTVGALFYFGSEPDAIFRAPLSWTTTGTINQWYLYGTAATDRLTVEGYNAAGTLITTDFISINKPGGITNTWMFVYVSAHQNGANIDWTAEFVSEDYAQSIAQSDVATIGLVQSLLLSHGGGANDSFVGHGFVADADIFATVNLANLGDYIIGFAGETAADRMVRLCAEEGISLQVLGDPASTALVGSQGARTLLDLLQEAASADGGILYEPRGVLGLAYRTRTSLYNQPADLALDYAAGHLVPPLEPVDDDQGVRNDVTVARTNGSSARAVLDTGALSTQAPPGGVGVYDEDVTLNVFSDDQLADIASWRVHLGTWDEARYPTVTVDLVAVPALIAVAAAVDVGDYLSIDSLPAWLPPDLIELLAQGSTEKLAPFEWRITWNATPAGPYRVGVLDSATLGKLDTDGSTLAEDLTTTETAVDVATTNAGSPLWTTAGGQFPFDIRVGGERMTVTAISGASSPQTFTVVRSVNGVVKTHSTGADVRLWTPLVLAL